MDCLAGRSESAKLAELFGVIGSSKDENGSKYAVKRLSELLVAKDTVRLHDLLVGTAEESKAQLLRLWDQGVAKNASPQYVEQFCLIFKQLRMGTDLVHPKRIRIVHSLLSSGNRTKVSCALLALKGVPVPIILERVDFSLGALDKIGVPPKVTGGKLMNATDSGQDGDYANRLWRSRDLAKRPTRVAYVDLFRYMLRECDPRTLSVVFSLRNFAGGALGYVSKDPFDAQEDMLSAIKECVLDLDDVVMTPISKWNALSGGKFLTQVSQVIEQCCERLKEQSAGDAEKADLNLVRRVLELASDILCDTVIAFSGTRSGKRSMFWRGLHELRPIRALMLLRPLKCHEHARIMHRTFQRSPLIAAMFLRDVSIDLDAKKTTSYIINASLLISAFDAVTRGMLDIESVSQNRILDVWKSIYPIRGVSKIALSRGLQHSEPISGTYDCCAFKCNTGFFGQV
jgi:hypothetical protein